MFGGKRIGSKSHVLQNLRALIRVIRSESSHSQIHSCPVTQHILCKYRKRKSETHREQMRAYRAEGVDVYTLLKGTSEQRRLWDLDAGLEKKISGKELIHRSANRVGLVMPETFADREDIKLANQK